MIPNFLEQLLHLGHFPKGLGYQIFSWPMSSRSW